MAQQTLRYMVMISLDKGVSGSKMVMLSQSWPGAMGWLKGVLSPKRKRIRLDTWYKDDLVGFAKITKLKRGYTVGR